MIGHIGHIGPSVEIITDMKGISQLFENFKSTDSLEICAVWGNIFFQVKQI